jgi:murein endopeptidase
MENDFIKLKEHILKEKGTFDTGEASRHIGLSSTVFYSAMRKMSFDELTEGELRYIEEMVSIMDDRKQRIDNLAKSAQSC